MFYTVLILVGFSLFVIMKNPKRVYNWLLFLLVVLTAARIAAIVFLVAKYGYYHRFDYPLFLFDYKFSLHVFKFRYGPYDIGSIGYLLEFFCLVLLMAFYSVFRNKKLTVKELLVGLVIAFGHLLLHLPSVRYALYIYSLNGAKFSIVVLYYSMLYGFLFGYLFYCVYLCILLYRSAKQSVIKVRLHEKLSDLAIVGTSLSIFLLFSLVDPVRLHMIKTHTVASLIEVSLQYEIPKFYVVYLPIIVFLILLINVYMLFRYSRVAFKDALVLYFQERMMQKINQAVRFLFHSLKNDFFALALISKELKELGESDLFPLLKEHDEITEQGLETIARFLDQTTGITIQLGVCYISTILNPIVMQLSALYPTVQITVDINQDVPLLVDRKLYIEAVRNCCINAAEAAKANLLCTASVYIDTKVEDQWLGITISDTGRGLTPAEQRRLFRPLKSGSVRMSNWGIGLNYSYRILRAHRGSITASRKVSIGAEFELTAPIVMVKEKKEHATT